MIGRLAGRIEHRGSDHVLLDVRGVGYVVQVSPRTLAALPGVGEAAALWTELLVREDALTLVGFPTLHEKEWHHLLTTVQGVGSKAAMAILSTLGADGIGRALALGDWASIKAAPGIGPKTAQRLVMELKDKAPVLMATATSGGPAAPVVLSDDAVIETARSPAAPRPAAQAAPQAEAMSALSNLGYAPSEAASAVARAAGEAPDAATPALIRAALKLLAPKG
jgi:Holliday junction DNA helicase RuvA